MIYSYKAKVSRVIDGDTLYLTVDLGFRVFVELEFRLFGINTPEVIGTEKAAGLAAKAELEHLLGLGDLRIESTKADKYGRWLCKLYVTHGSEEIYINQALIDGGFAMPYFGAGPKLTPSVNVP